MLIIKLKKEVNITMNKIWYLIQKSNSFLFFFNSENKYNKYNKTY
jgi:hypothetical protein